MSNKLTPMQRLRKNPSKEFRAGFEAQRERERTERERTERERTERERTEKPYTSTEFNQAKGFLVWKFERAPSREEIIRQMAEERIRKEGIAHRRKIENEIKGGFGE